MARGDIVARTMVAISIDRRRYVLCASIGCVPTAREWIALWKLHGLRLAVGYDDRPVLAFTALQS